MRLRELLNEVVFTETPEQALAGYLNRAPSELVKQWLLKNFWNWAKKDDTSRFLYDFIPPGANDAQKTAFAYKDLYSFRMSGNLKARLDHMMDWFRNNPEPPRLDRMTPEQVEQAANKEMEIANKRAEKLKGQAEPEENFKVMMEFPGGYRMVELLTQPALDREGNYMGHCIGSAHGKCLIVDKTHRAFSLRDSRNMPHATIEIEVGKKGSPLGSRNQTTEIKGKRNVAPVRRYWEMIAEFLEKNKFKLYHDSENIGRINITQQKWMDNPNGSGQTLKDVNVMMSLDQFKDMIEGEPHKAALFDEPKHLANENSLFGLFNAYYGSPKMSDEMIENAFKRIPDSALAVVEHHGNKMTPEQSKLALFSLTVRTGRTKEEQVALFVDAFKPDQDLFKYWFNSLPDGTEDEIRQARTSRDNKSLLPFQKKNLLIAGLSKTNPEMYLDTVNIPEELENPDANRFEAPYWAHLKLKRDPTPEMTKRVFKYDPRTAIENTPPTQLNNENMRAAWTVLDGWHDISDVYDGMKKQFPLHKKDLDYVVSQSISENLAKAFIADPDYSKMFDKEQMQGLAMKTNDPESFGDYLKRFQDVSEPVQHFLIDKSLDNSKHESHTWKSLLHTVDSFDDSTWIKVMNLLRPKAIKSEKPEDHSKEMKKNAHAALEKFTDLLGAMIFVPDNPGVTNDEIRVKAKKVKQADQAFKKQGKEKLLKVAIRRVAREKAMSIIRGGDRWDEPRDEKFKRFSKILSDGDIAYIMDSYWGKHLFGTLVNHAPQRVPGVMIKSAPKVHRKSDMIWGKFDHKNIIKDKAFESLEHVWATPSVPESMADEYTLVVLKRFKPSPAKLLSMLEIANNSNVTMYILKKTKAPKDDLMKFAFDQQPNLFLDIPLDRINDHWLTKAMANKKLAELLIRQELRGHNLDKHWNRNSKNIDRLSDSFRRLQQAAEKAGVSRWFETYIRGAEHNDNDHLWSGDDHEMNRAYIEKHIHEFHDGDLITAARKDKNLISWYFHHLSPERSAELIHSGLTKEQNWSDNKYDYTQIPETVLRPIMEKYIDFDDFSFKILNQMTKNLSLTDSEKKRIISQGRVEDVGKHLFKNSGDELKDWVARSHPDLMKYFEPNRVMVEKLFSEFGKIKNKPGVNEPPEARAINDTFFKTIMSWFNYHRGYGLEKSEFKPNPELEQMLREIAFEVGGISPAMLKAVLEHMMEGKRSYDSPSVVPLTPVKADQLEEALRLLV